MSQPDATTDAGDSTADNIAPTIFNHDNLDISGVPAVVTWVGLDAGSDTRQHLSHSAQDLALHIHRDASSDTAFLQLKTNIALKARRDRSNIFVSIPPERVRTVDLVEDDGGKELATGKLSSSTHCLRLHLSRPPSLIVPKGDLTPKQKTSRDLLDSLRSLAKQTSFSIHIPCSTMAKARLVSFCEAVSSSPVHSTPKFADVASLYGGKGGRVIEHDPEPAVTSGLTAAGTEDQSPPSYDELGLSSPPRPKISQKSGSKRRRASSGSDHTSYTRSNHPIPASIEKICMKMMERVENGFNEIGSRLDRMEHRLADLESCVERRADELSAIVERGHQRSSEQVNEVRDELDRGLHDVRQETEDIITLRVEDEMYIARGQLEDFVKDEIAGVEESLEEKLQDSITSANVSLDFSWNR